MRKGKWCTSGLACLIFALATVQAYPAQADVLINVDFNANINSIVSPTYAGAAAFGSAGDKWNAFSESIDPVANALTRTNLALVDSGNAATAARLSYTLTPSSPSVGAFDASNSSPFFGRAGQDLMRDYLFVHGTGSFTISGLAAGQNYELVLYSSANDTGLDTAFTVGSDTHHLVTDKTIGVFTSGTNFTLFNTVADPSGAVSFAMASDVEARINGFQLTAVPLPASASGGVLLLGMIAAAKRVRRVQPA